jgi:hypothetical protein
MIAADPWHRSGAPIKQLSFFFFFFWQNCGGVVCGDCLTVTYPNCENNFFRRFFASQNCVGGFLCIPMIAADPWHRSGAPIKQLFFFFFFFGRIAGESFVAIVKP